jgi:hypothetical protein
VAHRARRERLRLHLEIADAGSDGSRRVVVEISNDPPFAAARLRVNAAFKAKFGHDLAKGGHKEGDDAPLMRLDVAGYRFWDGSHWCNGCNPQGPNAGNHHGTAHTATLWELHPVLGVESAEPL